MRSIRSTLLILLLVAVWMPGSSAGAGIGDLNVLVGASPAGGYDQTARAVGKALQESGAVGTVNYQYKTGGGGTVALTHLVENRRGDSSTLLVTGAVMVGATIQNNTSLTLAQATPIGRLIAECNVIVVRPESPWRTMNDLLAAMKRNPAGVPWGGGSKGSVDHVSLAMIAQATGLDFARLNYVPFRGGGEVTVAVLGGHVAVGTSGYGELSDLIRTGRLRALALTGRNRLTGVDVPTLKEQGIDAEICNWRGLHAPPGITPAQRATLVDALVKAVGSPSWTDSLQRHQWEGALLVGDDFGRFVEGEQARIRALMTRFGMM